MWIDVNPTTSKQGLTKLINQSVFVLVALHACVQARRTLLLPSQNQGCRASTPEARSTRVLWMGAAGYASTNTTGAIRPTVKVLGLQGSAAAQINE